MKVAITEMWHKTYEFDIPDTLAHELEALDTRIMTGGDTTEVREKFAKKVEELIDLGAEKEMEEDNILDRRVVHKIDEGGRRVWLLL